MRVATQFLLNFLLNAIWQVTAIALGASVGNYLLKSVTRFRHLLWVSALVMSLALPMVSAVFSMKGVSAPVATPPVKVSEAVINVPANVASIDLPAKTQAFVPNVSVGQRTAIGIAISFFVLFAYRSAGLLKAWMKTRAIRGSASSIEIGDELRAIIDRCRAAFGVQRFRVLGSETITSPATVGILKPLVILPHQLLSDGDANALTAAIGHELVHVARRDYLLNLIYEVMFLPLSFHPAAALMKRQITKTRELRCDELVAERLLHHEAYARSLVRLATWAVPLNRRAQTIVVGIADADILEVRVMSLLNKTKSSLRRNILLAIAAALLLAVPVVGAAAFAINFNVEPTSQEPSREMQQERRQKEERAAQEMREWERQNEELKERIEHETDATVKAKLEQELKQRLEERDKTVFTFDRGGRVFTARMRNDGYAVFEQQSRNELAKAAKISMDQAIQIATSASPGKVIESSLVGERWSGEGESAKPGLVLYHVVVLSGDEANPTEQHVWVNATDGSVWKTEKEERKRENPTFMYERRREPINGGVLNGKAISLPVPKYPDIARQAKASGSVSVEIVIDETGHVVEAHAVSGHPLLQSASVDAARQAVFAPTRLEGVPVKVAGTVVYNFVVQ